MSFGDLAPGSLPIVHTPTAVSELRGALKALAANNASLQRTSALLRSDDPEARPDLKRVRALRDQNREMARAASQVAARVDMEAGRTGGEVEARCAREVRGEFQKLVEDFSVALRESVEAEKVALASASPNASPTSVGASETEFSEGQVALHEERIRQQQMLQAQARETDPLLGSNALQTARERAMEREMKSNESLVQERNAVLTEIQSSVDDVNSIFKDLAVMIGDQASQIEYVEVAVGDAAENVAGARRELEKTQQRRAARKSFFFCTLLSIACVIAVFLIILLS